MLRRSSVVDGSKERDGPLLSSSDKSWSGCSAISLNTSSKVKCIVEWGPAVAGGSHGVVAAEEYETQV